MHERKLHGESDDNVKDFRSSDTTFSNGSLAAALRAAGAVCHAIDAVVQKHHRNAFCVVRYVRGDMICAWAPSVLLLCVAPELSCANVVVSVLVLVVFSRAQLPLLVKTCTHPCVNTNRPPGHHAGVNGLILESSSCGFCIFNNVAIGALHALATYPKLIRRVRSRRVTSVDVCVSVCMYVCMPAHVSVSHPLVLHSCAGCGINEAVTSMTSASCACCVYALACLPSASLRWPLWTWTSIMGTERKKLSDSCRMRTKFSSPRCTFSTR